MKPWDVDRLTLIEFQGFTAAADEFAARDRRFAREE